MSKPIEYGKHWSEVLKELNAENARLKAEVERLTKAGDAAFQGLLKYVEPTDGYLTYLECRANWNAAKEGKPPA